MYISLTYLWLFLNKMIAWTHMCVIGNTRHAPRQRSNRRVKRKKWFSINERWLVQFHESKPIAKISKTVCILEKIRVFSLFRKLKFPVFLLILNEAQNKRRDVALLIKGTTNQCVKYRTKQWRQKTKCVVSFLSEL